MTVPTTRMMKNGLVTGKVAVVIGTIFLLARDPAMARAVNIVEYRPIAIPTTMVKLKKGVLVVRPAAGEPLLTHMDA